jgi:hypothetical protein
MASHTKGTDCSREASLRYSTVVVSNNNNNNNHHHHHHHHQNNNQAGNEVKQKGRRV